MNDDVLKAALAGLLHDIGKFAERTTEGAGRDWTEADEKRYAHKHAMLSADFVATYVPQQWAKELSGPALHHRPASHQDRVVAVANRLSAGQHPDAAEKQPGRLRSIFCSLFSDDRPEDDGHFSNCYLPLKPLRISQDVIFPTLDDDGPRRDYDELWREFSTEAAALREIYSGDQANLSAYLSGLLNLMQRFTWSIPAAYYDSVADVSLYDHSRMTAALAACLINRKPQWVTQLLQAEAQEEPVALLVGGDISGVQKFIYTITSSGAARSLRGRSFYLQMLTEAVAQYVLNQLGLPLTNLIYAGGGNFFLLAAPNQANELKEIRTDVSLRLLEAHDGDMRLSLGHATISANEFGRAEFYKAWQRMYQHLNQMKMQPLAELDDSRLAEEIGQPMGIGGDTDQMCNVCGREAAGNESFRQETSGGEDIRICGMCDSLARLGNQLARTTHLITVHTTPQSHQQVNKWWKGLETFGMNVWTVNAHEQPEQDRYVELTSHISLIEVTQLTARTRYEAQLEAELGQGNVPILKTFRPWTQLVPVDAQGHPLTFDALARASSGGLKRWGVLRMDVDNLGNLFEQGFRRSHNGQWENSLTVSRLASLSFALRLFFEGWVPRLGQTKETLQNRLYVQYAGGDDLFVVGSWDALPEFAQLIRQSFADYVCQHPAVTLSGGIALAPEKYPLYQAAREAGEAEHAAKGLIRGQDRPDGGPRNKDAFGFLGQVVGWESFGHVRTRAHQFSNWCTARNISRSLLQTLSSIHAEYKRDRDQARAAGRWKSGQLFFGPWMWHLAYQLARRIKDRRTPTDVARELERLEQELLGGQDKIETIGLAARWAQFLIRETGGNNGNR